jgi:hypothetical protein
MVSIALPASLTIRRGMRAATGSRRSLLDEGAVHDSPKHAGQRRRYCGHGDDCGTHPPNDLPYPLLSGSSGGSADGMEIVI